jgi:hypothetical protein
MGGLSGCGGAMADGGGSCCSDPFELKLGGGR